MLFDEEYKNIFQMFKDDFTVLDQLYDEHFNTSSSKSKITPIVREFFTNKGKRLRALIPFLVMRALNKSLEKEHYEIIFSYELIHSATLIHDDIIDCSLLRRGRNTLNFDYDSKLAVLTGDYLLSVVLNILAKFNNAKVRQYTADSIYLVLNGELNQYFNRFKILSLEEYIEKSKNKTAALFEAVLKSCLELSSYEDVDFQIGNFITNFGIAFQIKNDLDKFLSLDANEDILNGDYTAPVIFYAESNEIDDDIKKLIKNINKTDSILKTEQLINKYIDLAVANLAFIEDNQYKQILIKLCELFRI